jgi:hypothetical protein
VVVVDGCSQIYMQEEVSADYQSSFLQQGFIHYENQTEANREKQSFLLDRFR